MTTSDLFLQQRSLVNVLPATFIDRAYSYALPEGYDAPNPGTFVKIPLGTRTVLGVVWDTEPQQPKNSKKIKEIIEVYEDITPLTTAHLEFIKRTAAYTLAPLGAVLKMSLSAPKIFDPETGTAGYSALVPSPSDNPKYHDILSYLHKGGEKSAAFLKKKFTISDSPLKTMHKKGLIEKVTISPPAPCQYPDPSRASYGLSPQQNEVAGHLMNSVRAHKYSATLLDGVTGSGKTEVYFEAVAEALKQDKQVLILLPEIALSNAFLERFELRFGCAPALWHSALSPGMRRRTWRSIVQNKTKVVIGARSALFLPFQTLGLIIVDEEHDPAYKQEDQVIYHARDMAVLRAYIENIPICLISATPALETIQNAWEGRYEHLHLPERFGGAQLPDIRIIDMREHKCENAQHFISEPVRTLMQDTSEDGNQCLLFLNRRGYAPLTLCRNCGHRFECPSCSAWLTQHKNSNLLLCHHCGHQLPKPEICPACGEADSLAPCGPGVERIAEEAASYFPEKHIEILSSDLSESNDALKAALERIKSGAADIIIGTQIIAKGHHFPKLTSIGVIDADIGMEGGDLRAMEKTYHLLHQVSGRAGREKTQQNRASQVLIQSWMPDNPVLQALARGLRDEFFSAELEARQSAHMPPYSRLVAIILSGSHEEKTLNAARLFAQNAPASDDIQVLGPAPAPLSRLRDKYRFRLLVIAKKSINIQKTMRHWKDQTKIPSNIHIQIDIDPQSFL